LAIEVGSVEVEVVPSARGFKEKLRSEVLPIAREVGTEIGREIGSRIADEIQKGIKDGLNGVPTGQGRRQGTQFGRQFGDAAKDAIAAALANLPDANVDIDDAEAKAELERLRQMLRDLSTQRIGIDIDGAAALARINQVRDRLAQLATESPNVQVRASVIAASAELEKVQQQVDALDRERVNIPVNVGGSGLNTLDSYTGRLGALAAAIAIFSPLAAPVGAVAAASLAGIGVAAVTSIGGVGALALALNGIGDAVDALRDKDKQAGQDAADRAEKIVAAQQQETNARRAAAAAGRAVSAAETAADQAREDAARRVAEATQRAADARVNAARQNAAANRAAIAAEGALADAQRASRQATLDVIEARKEAAQQLQDLASQVANGALDERGAVLALQDAKDDLAETKTDPLATPASIAEAQLAYDQAKQNLADIRTQNSRLADEKAKADRKGVEGSDLVVDALQRQKDATAAVADAEAARNDARAAQQQTQVDGERAIKDATDAVTDAQREQTRAVLAAQASLADARDNAKAAADAVEKAVGNVAKARTELSSSEKAAATAMAQLSKAGQNFANYVHDDLLPDFIDMRNAAQGAFFPGFERFLKQITGVHGVLTLITRLADAAGGAFDHFGQVLGENSKTFGDVADSMGKKASHLFNDIAEVIANVLAGFGELFLGFDDYALNFSDGLVKMSENFRKWAKEFTQGDDFKKFMEYVKRNGPVLLDTLYQLARMVLKILKAMAPIGEDMLPMIRDVAKWIANIDTDKLTLVLRIVQSLVIAFTLFRILRWVWKLLSLVWKYGKNVAGVFKNLPKIVGSVRDAFSKLGGAVGRAVDVISDAPARFAGALAAISTAINLDDFAEAFGALGSVIRDTFTGITDYVSEHFIGWLAEHMPGVLGIILDPFAKAGKIVPNLIAPIRTSNNSVIAELRKNWPTVLANMTGPFATAARLIGQHMVSVRGAGRVTVGYLRGQFDTLVGYFTGLPGRIAVAAHGMWDGITEAFRAAINTIIGWWDGLHLTIGGTSVLGLTIPSITLPMPHIPMLANGGIVTKPTLAMVGEAGAEAVVPLDDARLARLLGANTAALGGAGRVPAAGSSRGGDVHVTQTIVNPIPERASVSTPVALRRAAQALGALNGAV
jgi:hypothetical protein